MQSKPVMVQVQKPDGTFVEMTLDEVQKLKQTPLAPALQKAPVLATSKIESAPVKVEPVIKPVAQKINQASAAKENPTGPKVAPVQTAQTKKPDVAVVKPFTKEDSASLLEESVPIQDDAILPRVSGQREAEVDEVIKQLTFTISRQHLNRLRTVVQLRLKDVRSPAQTREVLMRKALEGGVELSEAQANEVIALCARFEPQALVYKPTPTPTAGYKGPTLPQTSTEPLPPATATPYNSFVHGEAKRVGTQPNPLHTVAAHEKNTETSKSAPVKSEPSRELPEEIISTFKLSSSPRPRTTMNDVVVKPVEMSAIDEIRYFSLTDFRRLSSKPEEAIMRLKQKFTNLKEESILFYLDALTAWHASPLYLEYVAALTQSLTERKNLASVVGGAGKIALAEMTAVAHMNQSL